MSARAYLVLVVDEGVHGVAPKQREQAPAHISERKKKFELKKYLNFCSEKSGFF